LKQKPLPQAQSLEAATLEPVAMSCNFHAFPLVNPNELLESLSLDDASRIDQACCRFEDAIRSGQHPRIEDFLPGFVEPARSALLRELLLTEIEFRTVGGLPVVREAYERRFPGQQPLLDSVWRQAGIEYAEPAGADRLIAERDTVPAEGQSTQRESTRHVGEEDPLDFLGPPQEPGELGTVGGYRLLKVLGRGGMGLVFEALDPHLGRLVALKVMRPSLAAKTLARQRFLREARAMAAVEHDHVAPVYHVGEDHGVPFLAMPLLRGESLQQRLDRCRALSIAEAFRIGRQVAAGLAAAHARGLIHRDIKPDNIWLEAETDRVKILDFGLARAAEGDTTLTHAGTVMGTPKYMSPEQALGQEVDARSDLFSLGSVLYRLLGGQAPYSGDSVTAVLVSVALNTPQPLQELNPQVPPALAEVIERLMHKAPAQRYQSAQEVIAALDAAQQSAAGAIEPTSVREPEPATMSRSDTHVRSQTVANSVSRHPPPLLEPRTAHPAVPPRAMRRPLVYLAAAAVIVLGSVLAATQFLKNRPPPTPSLSLDGTVDVDVHDPDDPARPWQRLFSPLALPVRPTDRIRIQTTLNQPAYPYVLWLGCKGDVTPLYPWVPSNEPDWTSRPLEELPVRAVMQPDGTHAGYRVTGPTGMETIILMMRKSPLPKGVDAAVQARLKDRPPQEGISNRRFVAYFVNGELLRKDQDLQRGIDVSATEVEARLVALHADLYQRLRPYCDRLWAVSFTHVDE
jgi:serine/threonine protein kinase